MCSDYYNYIEKSTYLCSLAKINSVKQIKAVSEKEAAFSNGGKIDERIKRTRGIFKQIFGAS